MNEQELFALPGVVSLGIGFKNDTKELCLVVGVVEKKPISELRPEEIIPREMNGVRTDVIQTGVIRAFEDPTQRFRPLVAGISIGHKDITAGTLGCFVTKNGKSYVLSNNHVLANSNEGQIGDAIYQPGVYDGGTALDQVGTLAEFVPLNFFSIDPSDCKISNFLVSMLNGLAKFLGSGIRFTACRVQALTNTVDCALCEMSEKHENRILEIGTPKGSAAAILGDAVKKYGRTTLLTTGNIMQVDVTVQVAYDATGTKIGIFTGQLMAGPMSAGGDSGSAVLNMDDKVVGLLFAGSDTTTIMNPIGSVLSALGCEIER